jgi:fatty acid synthase
VTIFEHDRVSTSHDGGAAEPASSATLQSEALVDLLNAGEPYAVVFGGQGGAWLENLEELVNLAGIESELTNLVAEADLLLEPVARQLMVVRPIGFEPLRWVRALAAGEPGPTAAQLTVTAISGPGILLTQMAAIRALTRQGLDLTGRPPVAVAGHSQGIIALESLRGGGARDAELLAISQIIGAAGSLVSRRRGMVGRGEKTPMLSVSNADPGRIAELLEEFAQDVRTVQAPTLSIRNGRRASVITGTPEQLARFELYCAKVTEKEEAERKNKVRGGSVFSPVFNPVNVEVGFHTPRLAGGIELVERWAAETGVDSEYTLKATKAIFIDPVDWISEVEKIDAAGARWIVDLGPSDVATRLTAPVIRGLGIGIVPAATRGGHRSLFTPGAIPAVDPAWSAMRPVRFSCRTVRSNCRRNSPGSPAARPSCWQV